MSADQRPAISAAAAHAAAIDAAVEREVRIAEQTRPLRAALNQTDRYTDLRGEHYPLAAMSGAEALLVLALLERHAETLYRGELGERLLRAPAAGHERDAAVETHRRIAPTGAADWLRATPLHRALTERGSQ
jgi:hypothetical protein